MKIGGVLKASLEKLLERPRLFVPKLVSAAISSLWILGFIDSLNGSITLYLFSYPLIGLMGVFVSVMVASMVEMEENRLLLRRGFSSAVNEIKPVIVVTLLLMASGFVFSLPMSVGIALYYIYGSLLAVVTGLAVSLLLIFSTSFLIYFLPISMLKKGSAIESIKDSATMSFRNSREVTVLLVISLVLLVIAAVSQGTLEMLGAAGFVAGRLLNSVVTTYLFVVSPEYYLSSQEPR